MYIHYYKLTPPNSFARFTRFTRFARPSLKMRLAIARRSLVEDEFVETAKAVLAKAEKLGKKIILPSDVIVADKVSERSELALRKTRVNPLNSFGSLVSLVSLVLH